VTYDSLREQLEADIAAEAGDITTELEKSVAAAEFRVAGTEDRIATLQERLDAAKNPDRVQRLRAKLAAAEERLRRRTTRLETREATLARERSELGAAETRLDFFDNVRTLIPYMPPELALVFADAWIDTGDRELATATMQNSAQFDVYFPGIKRSDGSLRMTAIEYLGTVAGYEDVLMDVRVNPSFFASRFAGLIAGDVSVNEFRSRVNAMEERILAREDELRETYASFYGLEMTTEALLASVLDPTIGAGLVERQISIAEIGGEAALAGFAVTQGVASRLQQAGYLQQSARELFQVAGGTVPQLGRAASRQAEGSFGLNEFLESEAFADPQQRERLRRILAGEQSDFSEQAFVAADPFGRLTGLRQR
jgi:hypothetical protein